MLSNTCKGCLELLELGNSDFKESDVDCPAGLDITMKKCPCKMCLLKGVCLDPCELFESKCV